MEEALDSTTASEDKKREMEAMVDSFFKRGEEIYKVTQQVSDLQVGLTLILAVPLSA